MLTTYQNVCLTLGFHQNSCWCWNKSPQWFYTHTSIYSKLILLMVPNADNFHLTHYTIYRAKTGNTVSEFMHSNWITLSTIWVLNTRVCFPKCLIEHGLVTLTESFSPLKSESHSPLCWHPNEKWTLNHAIPFYTMYTWTRYN